MSRKSTSRRAFLKAMGAGTACAGLPGVSFARRGGSEESGREILDGASERIEKHRKGQAALTLTGPDGRPLPAGTNVEVRQTRHKFLFGCNIFKLGRCRTPEDNAAYAGRFASLLNFATLPFYWWSYERQRGEPRDGRTEEIIRWCKVHGITPKGLELLARLDEAVDEADEASMEALDEDALATLLDLLSEIRRPLRE